MLFVTRIIFRMIYGRALSCGEHAKTFCKSLLHLVCVPSGFIENTQEQSLARRWQCIGYFTRAPHNIDVFP